eukprot:scpid71407/ scgid35060/ LysM and putative peptidoglycan-binding domain-containing protein 1
MAERQEEKRTLNFSGNARSCGTAKAASVTRPKSTETIRHEICEGDTLQGLALRYGVSVELIRQENKLWTNDSMFLRPHLMIPLSNRQQPQAGGGAASASRDASPDGSGRKGKRKQRGETPSPRVTPSPTPGSTQSTSSRPSSAAAATASATGSAAPAAVKKTEIGELDKSSVSSFLASFDTQLSLAKTSVESLESTVAERVDELGASANAHAHAAAISYAERSKWEQKRSGKGMGVPTTTSPPPSSSFSGLRRFLPSSGKSERVAKTDSKTQAALDAQSESLFDL